MKEIENMTNSEIIDSLAGRDNKSACRVKNLFSEYLLAEAYSDGLTERHQKKPIGIDTLKKSFTHYNVELPSKLNHLNRQLSLSICGQLICEIEYEDQEFYMNILYDCMTDYYSSGYVAGLENDETLTGILCRYLMPIVNKYYEHVVSLIDEEKFGTFNLNKSKKAHDMISDYELAKAMAWVFDTLADEYVEKPGLWTDDQLSLVVSNLMSNIKEKEKERFFDILIDSCTGYFRRDGSSFYTSIMIILKEALKPFIIENACNCIAIMRTIESEER